MLIWFNLLIPLIAILISAIFFTKKMSWWEYILILVIPMAAISIAKTASVYDQTQDKEYWNTYLVKAKYTEYWSTWVKLTCERCETKCSGFGENRTCHEECHDYDCSYCDENPPTWTAWDNMGNSYGISQAKFEELCKIWGRRDFVDMKRDIQAHWRFTGTCGKDGDAYDTRYDGNFGHIQSVTSEHTYENRIKCSKTLFNFPDVDTADVRQYGLYKHNPVMDPYNYNPIYGPAPIEAVKRLGQWNAWLGAAKQIHMNILIFRNQPRHAAELQEWYWKRGNKNELVLCIGVDNTNKIVWTKIFSWTEVEMLKISLERTTAQMPYDLVAVSDTMGTYAQKLWQRKHFKDFKYISVEPTTGALIGAFIATILLTTGLMAFSLLNDFYPHCIRPGNPAGGKPTNKPRPRQGH